jgi:hypothetical protein
VSGRRRNHNFYKLISETKNPQNDLRVFLRLNKTSAINVAFQSVRVALMPQAVLVYARVVRVEAQQS